MLFYFIVINNITPSNGSLHGGTLITVTGDYFDDTNSPISVLVGGQICEVLNHTDTDIICETPPKTGMNINSSFCGASIYFFQ